MIFWNLILWAISFVATALLAPVPKIENARASSLGDVSFPRASEGFPVNKVWGRVKISSPNTLWYGDFEAAAIKKKVKVGLFKKKKITTGFKYYIGFDLGVCLGPNITLHKISMEKDVAWEGTINTQGEIVIDKPEFLGGKDSNGGIGGTIEFYPGSYSQDFSPYLDTQLGEETPSYVGVCHLVFRHFYIGKSAQLRQISFEVSCYTDSLGISASARIGEDINPMEMLYNGMITGDGGMLVDPGLIDVDSFRACAETLFTESNGSSVVVDGSTSFREFAVEILRQIDGIIYQDPTTSLVTARLIRNDFDFDDLPIFDDDDIVEVSNISKSMWSETFNQVRLVYKSRIKDYEDTAAYAEDMANISFQGRPKSTGVNFPLVKNDSLANFLAFRELSKLASPIFSASLLINRRGSALKPGDALRMTFSKYKLFDVIMRVQRFSSGTILDNRVKVEVYQDEYSVTNPVYAGEVTPGLPSPAQNAAEILSASIFQLPWFFANEQEDVVLPYSTHVEPYIGDRSELVVTFARRPNASTANYVLNYNYSLTEFSANMLPDFIEGEFSELVSYPPTCVIVDTIYEFDGFETGTIVITVQSFYRPVVTQSTSDARTGANLIFMNNELMAFTTVVDNMDGTWDLTARRGLLDTQAQEHAAGSRMYFLEDIGAMVEDDFNVSNFVKVKPIGIFGFSTQLPIEDQGEFSGEIVRRRDLPIAPDYLTIGADRTPGQGIVEADTITLNWRIRNRTLPAISFMTETSEDPNPNEEFIVDVVSGGTSYGEDTVSGTLSTLDYVVPATPLGPAVIRIRAHSTVDGSYSYSEETLPVTVVSGFILLSGDAGAFRELLSGDATDGNDAILISGT